METLRRLRWDGHPLALLGAYAALQAAIFGLAALPGGFEFAPNLGLIVLHVALVVFIARGSRLAWRVLLAWEVFAAALMLATPFLVGMSAGKLFLGAIILAVELLSIFLLYAPSLERHVLVGGASATTARRSAA